jgi:hypothetical protein
MGWVAAAATVASARQVSAIGKYNQAMQNRNAEVLEQESKRIEDQLEFDISRFEKQYEQLEGTQIVNTLKSGVVFEGTALRIQRQNAEEAELQKQIMTYNSKVDAARKLEEANFARMRGTIAKKTADSQALGLYAKAVTTVGTQTEFGRSLLS